MGARPAAAASLAPSAAAAAAAAAAAWPGTPAGMVRCERVLVGHEARVVLCQRHVGLAPAAWAQLAEAAAALDSAVAGSDLGRLAADGRSQNVSAQLFAALEIALDLAARSGGAWDPTRRAGSDQPAGAWRRIALTGPGRDVRLPAGIRLDLSDLFGALAVDAARSALSGLGAEPLLVQVDGCVGVRGAPAEGWRVVVAGRRRPVRLRSGALAVAAGRGGPVVVCAPTAAEAAVAAACARRAGAGAGRRPRVLALRALTPGAVGRPGR